MNIEIKENIIMGSIIYSLKNKFGNDYKYYDEVIEENFDRPSFHVYRIDDISNKGYTGNQHKMVDDSYRYVIKYFPSEKLTVMKDINDKIDSLKELFEYLNIINIVPNEKTGKNDIYSKPNRINSINATTSEGVLLFEIQFNIRTIKYTEKDKVGANVLTVGSNI